MRSLLVALASSERGRRRAGTMAPPKEASNADTRPKAEKIDDDRFKAIGKDPRFRRFPKKTSKVQVDDRFAGVRACVG